MKDESDASLKLNDTPANVALAVTKKSKNLENKVAAQAEAKEDENEVVAPSAKSKPAVQFDGL